ncbi:MAG: DNA repair protein RadC [Geminicoccaceae bacterium]|nr:MAG: DNA repair protein RadC [Geminicoccaceae bacterium]
MPRLMSRSIIQIIDAADRAVAQVEREQQGTGFTRPGYAGAGLAEPRRTAFQVDSLTFQSAGPNHLLARITGEGTPELDDVDMLEVLLFLSGARVDGRAMAEALVGRFGNLGGVLNASTGQLRDLDGMGEMTISMFKAIQATLRRVLRAPLEDPITIGSWQALVDYLGLDMRYERVETLRLLFLDRKNNLIRDETMHRGTVDHTPLYPREVAKRALELHASALIMAHNHPSGDPTPSRADIETTKQVQAALATLGIALHDHLILAARGITSLRSLGHIGVK